MGFTLDLMERPRDERVLWDFMRNVNGGKEDAVLTLQSKMFRAIYLAMWKLKPERRELTTPTGDGTDLNNESRSWHLSLNRKCIKWLSLEKKKKRKIRFSLLVLGTGSGDVLALAAQLKWRINYCHPVGTFSGDRLCDYIARFDGMICQTNSATRSLLGKFRASTKAISCMVFSHDGKRRLATAAGQASLKIFYCSDNKKISGHHPGKVSRVEEQWIEQWISSSISSCNPSEKHVFFMFLILFLRFLLNFSFNL